MRSVNGNGSSLADPGSAAEDSTTNTQADDNTNNPVDEPTSWTQSITTLATYPADFLRRILWHMISQVPGLSSFITSQIKLVSAVQPKIHAIWARSRRLLSATIAILTFIIACVTLWPTISGANDSKAATLLAQWTAQKDYYEFCESVRD
jgi:hypothetical protein